MITAFTPCHNMAWLYECYDGLRSQTVKDWQWALIANGPARGYVHNFRDARVKVINAPPNIDGNIGALKKLAAQQATGDVIMELDHDDILMPTAFEECAKAFEDPSVDFAYSNSVNHDYRVDHPTTYGGVYGWTHRPFIWGGRTMMESVSAAPYPQSISRIWYAPNHFRAWRREFYLRIGGHDTTLKVADDHDLICRTYIHGKMVHIDKPLYIYRITGENSWIKSAEEIQTLQWMVHDRHIMAMVEKWCRQENLSMLTLKSHVLPNNVLRGSVGSITTTNQLHFESDPVSWMNNAYLLLAHGGWLFITVPSSEGVGSCDRPGIRSHWNWRSIRYYTDKRWARTLDRVKCRFMNVKCATVPDGDGVPHLIAHLIAVKSEYPRFYGELAI